MCNIDMTKEKVAFTHIKKRQKCQVALLSSYMKYVNNVNTVYCILMCNKQTDLHCTVGGL